MQQLCIVFFDTLCYVFFRHVKVYNSSFKVVHSFEYAASILSMGIAVSCRVAAGPYIALIVLHFCQLRP